MNLLIILSILFGSCGTFSKKSKTNYPPPVITKPADNDYSVTKSSDIKDYYEKSKSKTESNIEVTVNKVEKSKEEKAAVDVFAFELPEKLESTKGESNTDSFKPDTSMLNYFELVTPGVQKQQYNIAILLPFKAPLKLIRNGTRTPLLTPNGT